MEEQFLHYIWRYQYFERPLIGSKGESITVINPGLHNTDAGPDFKDALIEINNLRWAGHVEIHKSASEWHSHGHHKDEAYENVVLHVVWDDNKEVLRQDGTPITSVSLKNKIDPNHYKQYQSLLKSESDIPCSNSLNRVDLLTKVSLLDGVVMERLIVKSSLVNQMLQQSNGDWDEVTYRLIARNFGFNTNSEAFLALAKSVPFRTASKLSKSLVQLESVFYGQAGFLEKDHQGDYFSELKREYLFYRHKYDLGDQLPSHLWKFLRLRPANFPTIRIAQFCQLIFEVKHLFSWFTSSRSYNDIVSSLGVSQSKFWRTHYDFDKVAERKIGGLGKSSIENIIVNTVVPILVAYGKHLDQQEYIERALSFLREVPPEKNRITRKWEQYNWQSKSALDSQGLIELYNSYCSKNKCLVCSIGNKIIQSQV